MKETGAKSRAEYIRDILTLWHDDKGVADVVRELVSVKEQRDEHLQACKSHIIEFRSIQELLGIDSGMACPERIVAKIKELSQQRVDASNNQSKTPCEQVERYDASGKIHEQVVKRLQNRLMNCQRIEKRKSPVLKQV